jgi:transcriptional regulator with XRE-family HTH domain
VRRRALVRPPEVMTVSAHFGRSRMPKRNAERPVGPEVDVARRIALERSRHQMTAAELSRRMTAVGCPINQSAINKIEQGDPPRTISTNELVAFAQVFGLEVEDLLLPPFVASDRHIVSLYKRAEELYVGATAASQVFLHTVAELAEVAALDSRMTESAQAALDELDRAFEGLDVALATVSAGVRQALRGPAPEAKPPTSSLAFRKRSSYDKRAAEAVAQQPGTAPARKSPRRTAASTKGPPADGQHPEAP